MSEGECDAFVAQGRAKGFKRSEDAGSMREDGERVGCCPAQPAAIRPSHHITSHHSVHSACHITARAWGHDSDRWCPASTGLGPQQWLRTTRAWRWASLMSRQPSEQPSASRVPQAR
eukprot:4183455-Prymnesium_polylepis.2